MTDPILTISGSDTGYDALVTKGNANTTKRRWVDQRFVVDANITIGDTDELIVWTATGAARSTTLPDASDYPGRELLIFVKAADVTNTATVNRAGSDTVKGTTSVVVNSNRQLLTLVSDGVSDWICTQATA